MSRLRQWTFAAAISLFVFAFVSLSGGQTITNAEYKIYSLVLKDVYNEQVRTGIKRPRLIVLSQTGRSNNEFVEKEDRRMRGLWRNLAQNNRSPARLSDRFPARYRVVLAEKAEIDALIAKGKEEAGKQPATYSGPCGPETWTYVYKRFLGAYEYFQLSRVGYSSNGKYAVVEAEGRGDGSSSNSTYWFKKTKIGWSFYQAGGGFGSC